MQAQYTDADSYSSKLYSNAYVYQNAKLMNHINLDAKTNSAVDINELLNLCADETIRQASDENSKDSKLTKWFADDFGKLIEMDPGKAREQLMIMSVEFVQLYSQLGDFAKTTKYLGQAIRETRSVVKAGRWSAFCLGLIQAAFGAIMISDWENLDIKEKIMAVSSCAYGLFSSAQYLIHIRDIVVITSVTNTYSKSEIEGAIERNESGTFRNERGNILGVVRSETRELLLLAPDASHAPFKDTILNNTRLQKILTATDRATRSFNILVLGLFAAVQVMTIVDEIKKKSGNNESAEYVYYVFEILSTIALTGSVIIESIELIGGIADRLEHSIVWFSRLPFVGGILSVMTMGFQIAAMIAHSYYSDPVKTFARNTLLKSVQNMPEPPEGWKPPEAA